MNNIGVLKIDKLDRGQTGHHVHRGMVVVGGRR